MINSFQRSVHPFFLLTFMLLSVPVLTLAQTKWKQLSPNTWIGPFSVLRVGPEKHVLSLGAKDRNIITKDGVSWQNTQVSNNFGSLPLFAEFASDSIVWAGYQNENMRKSTDGGATWFNTQSGAGLLEIKFLNPQIGFGRKKISATEYHLVKTTDGGNTWTENSTSNISADYVRLSVTGPDQIWAKSGNVIVRTNNAGETWESVDVGSPSPLSDASMLNSQFGYCYRTAMAYITTNGGTNWNIITPPASIRYLQFLNPNIGWYQSVSNKFYKTTDGGITWLESSQNFRSTLSQFNFITENEGWALVGSQVWHTGNGGDLWKHVSNSINSNLNSVSFRDSSQCWITGDNGTILHSENNGKNWNSVQVDSNENFIDIKFWGQNGILVGNAKTYHSTDGGQSWSGYDNPTSFGSVYRNQFMDNHNGVLVMINPTTGVLSMHRTTNKGVNWAQLTNPLHLGVVVEIDQIYFVDSIQGFASGIYEEYSPPPNPPPFNPASTKLFKTNDGGNTWIEISSYNFGLMAVPTMNFTSMQTGTVFSTENKSYFTNDGGISFTLIQMSSLPGASMKSILKCEFINDSVGYVLSRSGRIFKTTNGGSNWSFDSYSDSTSGHRSLGIRIGKPTVIVGAYSSIFGDSTWIGVPTLFAKGKIAKTENQDCFPDPNEMPLPNRIVISEPGNYFTSTGSNGIYSVEVEKGMNLIRQIYRSPLHNSIETQFCPSGNSDIELLVGGVVDTLEGNNFMNDLKPCPVLVLSQSQECLRPCRKSTLHISVENFGIVDSDTELLYIKLPPELVLLSASTSYDLNETDSSYRIKIRPLQPFETASFTITDSVRCVPSGLTGQNLCIKSIIPNIPNCFLQSPNWDGANLEVASRCQNGQTKFTLHNKGAAMATTSQYQIFIDSALVYQAPFQLAANSAMTVSIPGNAPSGFVRLVVPQSTNHPLSTFASAEANCSTGQSSNGMFPPPDESPLVDIECVMVTNSLDPNDKQVFPTGWGTGGNVEPGTEFKYTVRFQNTGSDTAFKVVLIDTLDADLDIASLQIGNASHNYSFKVSGKGRPVLTWTFNNILLPDSNTNEEKSHGFVSYSVRPKAGLTLGTRLENFADIYFDFNDPIRTNTTVNTLWQPTYTPGVLDTVFVTESKKPMAERDLSIYPNPTKGKMELNSPKAGWLTLYSTKGDVVLKTRIEAGGNIFNFTQIPKGLYLAKFQFTEGLMSKKIILE